MTTMFRGPGDQSLVVVTPNALEIIRHRVPRRFKRNVRCFESVMVVLVVSLIALCALAPHRWAPLIVVTGIVVGAGFAGFFDIIEMLRVRAAQITVADLPHGECWILTRECYERLRSHSQVEWPAWREVARSIGAHDVAGIAWVQDAVDGCTDHDDLGMRAAALVAP